jgi:biotin carboxyl carrier protein
LSLYTVTIEDRIYKVNISGNHCTVNGKEVDARMLPLNRNGLHVLRRGKEAYELFLSSHEADTYQMLLFGGRRIVTQITRLVKRHLLADNDSKVGSLNAPMHGLVVDVCTHVGDTVEKGETLVVLESMKMQMQLRSPRAGKVTKLTTQAGALVEKGALLVQFDE